MVSGGGIMYLVDALGRNDRLRYWCNHHEQASAIAAEARKHGFTRDDVLVDGIVMTAASNPKAPQETIRTVRWATETFGARTVVGLSNVSFGMPERKWINASFLAMAAASGLTAAIANPASEELLFVKRAADVLGGRDRDAAAWIAHCAKAASTALASRRTPKELTTPNNSRP